MGFPHDALFDNECKTPKCKPQVTLESTDAWKMQQNKILTEGRNKDNMNLIKRQQILHLETDPKGTWRAITGHH